MAKKSRRNPDPCVYCGAAPAAVGAGACKRCLRAHGELPGPSAKDIEKALNAYMDTALSSSTDHESDEPLDKEFSTSNISEESAAKMARDVTKFLTDNMLEVNGYMHVTGEDLEKVGGYFWHTRNGAGVGFWDIYPHHPLGDELSKAAKKFGQSDLYVGDDDELHVTP